MANVVQITLSGIDKLSAPFNKPIKSMKDLRAAADGMALAMKGAAIAATAALTAITLRAINAADEIGKLADVVGFKNVEAFSKLAFAAELADVSLDDLRSSLNTLNRSMATAAADAGSRHARAFDALGIAVTDATGKMRSNEEVLNDIADRFSGFEEGANKSAMAMLLFGDAGARMLPLLNEGADGIRKIGDQTAGVSAETGKAADQFKDSVAVMQRQVMDLGLAIAQELLPHLISMAQWMVKIQTDTDAYGQIARFVTGVVKAFVIGVRALAGWLQILGTVLGYVAGVAFEGLRQAVDSLIDIFKRYLEAIKGVAGALSQFARGDFLGAFLVAKSELADMAADVGGEWKKTFDTIRLGGAAAFRELVADIGRQVQAIEKFTLDIDAGARPPGVSNAQRQDLGQAPAVPARRGAGGSGRAPQTNAEIRSDFIRSMAEQEQETLVAIDLLKEENHVKDMARLAELQTFHQTFAQVVITAHQGWITLLSNATQTVLSGLSGAVNSIIFGAQTAAEAFRNLGKAMVASVVDFMVQKIAAFALEKALASASKALLAGQLLATNAIAQGYAQSWAVPATLALIGTYGAAAAFASLAPTLSALNQGIAAAQTASGVALAGFATGVDRVPFDMPAVVHRGERIVQADVNSDLTEALEMFRAGGATRGGPPLVVEVNLDGETLARGIGRMSDEGRLTINARSIV